MSILVQRPKGETTKVVAVRIIPSVIDRVEEFARQNLLGSGLAYECLLNYALDAHEAGNKIT